MTPGDALNIVEILNKSKDMVKGSKLLESLNFVFPNYTWYWSKNTIQVSGSKLLKAKDFEFLNELELELDNFHLESSMKDIRDHLNLYQESINGLKEVIEQVSAHFYNRAHLYFVIDHYVDSSPHMVIYVRQKNYAHNLMRQIEKASDLYIDNYLKDKLETDLLLTSDYRNIYSESDD